MSPPSRHINSHTRQHLRQIQPTTTSLHRHKKPPHVPFRRAERPRRRAIINVLGEQVELYRKARVSIPLNNTRLVDIAFKPYHSSSFVGGCVSLARYTCAYAPNSTTPAGSAFCCLNPAREDGQRGPSRLLLARGQPSCTRDFVIEAMRFGTSLVPDLLETKVAKAKMHMLRGVTPIADICVGPQSLPQPDSVC